MSSDEPLLAVENLRTEFKTESGTVTAANDVTFELESGEMLGIVGESGAGKSVTARSIMRLIDSPGEITGGEVRYKGEDLLQVSEKEMRQIRGNQIALIPQDPMSSLNPVLTVGEQIVETITHHQDVPRKEAREIAIEAMEDVEIPDARDRFGDYPHEFSGGMRQRILVAIGLSCEPDLLIADEPTTALDVTTQAKILDLLNALQDERDLSILLITHNLGVVAQICNYVGVMYAGNVVERAALHELFRDPKHPYTRALINSIPDTSGERTQLQTLEGSMPDLFDLPSGCNFADRCEHATEECKNGDDPALEPVVDGSSMAACFRKDELNLDEPSDSESVRVDAPKRTRQNDEPLLQVRNLEKHFTAGDGLFGGFTLERGSGPLPTLSRKRVKAVDGVSFSIYEGETLGLVGESGCGKSTVARSTLKLLEPTAGEIYFDEQPLHEMDGNEVRSLRKDMQMIFQDPVSSLNPRKTVGQIIGRALEKHDVATGDEKRTRIEELLEQVGLSADAINKYPHEFSGGQAQRIGIAHALAVEPKLIICDEPVSALDVSVQAQILNLLEEIQDAYDISYLFISHNIGVVRHICDRLAVMYLGKIVESGTVERVFDPPYHPYTESLLSAVPHADPDRRIERILLEGSVPSPINPPSGCPFQTRCPKKIGEQCETQTPVLEEKERGSNHQISCHLSVEEMSDTDNSLTTTIGETQEP